MSDFNATKTAGELAYFINQRVHLAGKDGVVLGLSGGVDSAVCAVLAQRASVKLTPLWMPLGPQEPPAAADCLAEKLDTHLVRWPIDPMSLPEYRSDLLRGNWIARLRMVRLYDTAARYNALVLGTSNRTERLLGYFTKFGDECADLAPLLHIFKTDVYRLAKHLRISKAICEQPPSAGLWEGQTDEAELGWGYEAIDAVLRDLEAIFAKRSLSRVEYWSRLVEPEIGDICRELVVEKHHDAGLVHMIVDRVRENRHKLWGPCAWSP